MNNLNQLILKRLKSKHTKLSKRFLRGVETGNFQQQTGRKRYKTVERLKRIERQIKTLGQKSGFSLNLNFKHWAVALAFGIVVQTASAQQKNSNIVNKKWINKVSSRKSTAGQNRTEDQTIFFAEAQKLGEPAVFELLIGDIDDDGDDDAIYISYLEEPLVLTNEGGFTFTQSSIPVSNQEVVRNAFLGDFDGDGDNDFLLIHGSYLNTPTTVVFINDGAGEFTETAADIGLSDPAVDFDDIGFFDFDGDDDLDHLYLDRNATPQTLRIFINDGLIFTEQSSSQGNLNLGVNGFYGVADMDGDNDLDIVYRGSDGANDGLRILDNDGTGIITDNGYHNSTIGYNEVGLGDLDNDGDIDIAYAISSYPDINVEFLIQDTPGNFNAGTLVVAEGAEFPDNLEVVDMNGDGSAELLLSGDNNTQYLFANLGAATFDPEVAYNVLWKPANLDNNADLDFLVIDGDLTSFENQGSFSFSQNSDILNIGTSYDTDAVDIDNDGDIDIVQGDAPKVWLNDGDGIFTLSQQLNQYEHTKQVFGDLDGDGDPDMVVVSEYDFGSYVGISIWRSDAGTLLLNNDIGAGTFNVVDVQLTDLDGDTDIDIAAIVKEGSTQFYLRTFHNEGGFSFTQFDNYLLTAVDDNIALSVGDFDDDTDDDIALFNNGTIGIYLNEGGSFSNNSTITPSTNLSTVALQIGDLDGDLDLDIFSSNTEEYSLSSLVFLNSGTGTFTESPEIVPTYGYQSALADLDNDGDLDIITTDYFTRVNVFLNEGNAVFVKDDIDLGAVDEYAVPAFGDFDGDGDQDLVIGGYYTASKVFLNELINDNPLQADSIALVALYDATDGDNWTDNTNWKTGDLSTWAGVVNLDAEDVLELDLSTNNLVGSIPSEFADLTGLVSADLSGNVIDAIEGDFSVNSSITNFDLSNNSLDFGDFEQLSNLSEITIGEQIVDDIIVDERIPAGDPSSFDFIIDGANNQYQWFRNGEMLTDSTRNDIVIDAIGRDTQGEYFCEAISTTPGLESLTLTSALKTVIATSVVDGTLKVNETENVSSGLVRLLRVTNDGGFDSLYVADIVAADNGAYQIEDVTLDDYLVVGVADADTYPDAIPTYFTNTVFWDEADTVFLAANTTIDITTVFSTTETVGVGAFSGILEEELPDGGRTEVRGRVRRAGVGMRRGVRAGRQEGTGELVYYVFTDDNGEFILDGIDPGEYNVDIQYPGYPMDEDSFLDIVIGSGPKDSEVVIEALVDEGVITVVQLVILGTDEIKNGVRLYPNPASNWLKIEDVENREDLTVQIHNMAGAQVKELSFSTDGQIQVNDLPIGQYIVTVTDSKGEELTTRKILIEKR